MNKDPQQLLLSALNDLETASKQPFIKSAHVLAAAIERAELLTPSRKKAIYTEVNPPSDIVTKRFYSVLIALVREVDDSKRLVVGQGNFGDADNSDPPANPLFNECRLTNLGRKSIKLR